MRHAEEHTSLYYFAYREGNARAGGRRSRAAHRSPTRRRAAWVEEDVIGEGPDIDGALGRLCGLLAPLAHALACGERRILSAAHYLHSRATAAEHIIWGAPALSVALLTTLTTTHPNRFCRREQLPFGMNRVC